ncbi:hypothetical protein ARMSODRAFT_973376 [Armillaria solidipes]|uniref:DUF6532 domain-containing protein n=1 Tax=Armillaria solidipes TaxID=1076256 RepID=A0A2H3C4R7_9AGAR|nr:hypothetical protein ARMSODRAFT_973376 [Armillaria solidipes]
MLMSHGLKWSKESDATEMADKEPALKHKKKSKEDKGLHMSDLSIAYRWLVEASYLYLHQLMINTFPWLEDSKLEAMVIQAWYIAIDHMIKHCNYIGHPAPTHEEIGLHCGDLKFNACKFVHSEHNPVFSFRKGRDSATINYNRELVKALKSKEKSFILQDPMGVHNLPGLGYYLSLLIGMVINERYFKEQHGKEGLHLGFFLNNEIPFTIECAIDEYERDQYKMVKFLTDNYGQKEGDGAVYMWHLNSLKEKYAGYVEQMEGQAVGTVKSMFMLSDFACDIAAPATPLTTGAD